MVVYFGIITAIFQVSEYLGILRYSVLLPEPDVGMPEVDANRYFKQLLSGVVRTLEIKRNLDTQNVYWNYPIPKILNNLVSSWSNNAAKRWNGKNV